MMIHHYNCTINSTMDLSWNQTKSTSLHADTSLYLYPPMPHPLLQKTFVIASSFGNTTTTAAVSTCQRVSSNIRWTTRQTACSPDTACTRHGDRASLAFPPRKAPAECIFPSLLVSCRAVPNDFLSPFAPRHFSITLNYYSTSYMPRNSIINNKRYDPLSTCPVAGWLAGLLLATRIDGKDMHQVWKTLKSSRLSVRCEKSFSKR